MTVILVFVVAAIAVALGWLLRQGVTSKPWLETGPSPALGTAMGPTPGLGAERVALGLFIVVVGALFALFGSAFVMRMDGAAWRSLALPPIVWGNLAPLALASLLLRRAAAAARGGDGRAARRDLGVAGLATAGFLVAQLAAWRELGLSGQGLTTGPAASFFYLLSGLHGLHVLGGLAALGLAIGRGGADDGRLAPTLGLCSAYWDFLLVVWLGVLALFLGWANGIVDICRSVLT